MTDEGRKASRRSYRPKVEALEALRLLSEGLVSPLSTLAVEQQPFAGLVHSPATVPTRDAAWDVALDQSRVLDLLESGPSTTRVEGDPEATVRDGIDQLNRYLGRAWARAGIAPQSRDDATQAVYETLLQQLGPDGFNRLLADVGEHGIREVFSRETPQGPIFFRAVDMVKKRTQRQKSHLALDDHQADLADPGGNGGEDWRGALHEAIARTLNSRETALIQETLLGKSPAEIALQWGLAPKTVSNEKSRAIQKLRDILVKELVD